MTKVLGIKYKSRLLLTNWAIIPLSILIIYGTWDRNRTGMLKATDFKSVVSTNFTTQAEYFINSIYNLYIFRNCLCILYYTITSRKIFLQKNNYHHRSIKTYGGYDVTFVALSCPVGLVAIHRQSDPVQQIV